MTVFRISKKAYVDDLSGTGARIYGGRWNRKGTSMLYTAGSRALAVLEVLVHTDKQLLPDNLVMVEISIPEAATIDEVKKLPKDWRGYPAPEALAAMGSDWATSRKSLVLKVPSAIIPEEFNFLINPLHKSFSGVSLGKTKPFQFDTRLV